MLLRLSTLLQVKVRRRSGRVFTHSLRAVALFNYLTAFNWRILWPRQFLCCSSFCSGRIFLGLLRTLEVRASPLGSIGIRGCEIFRRILRLLVIVPVRNTYPETRQFPITTFRYGSWE